VAADADEPFDLQASDAVGDGLDGPGVVGIDVVAGGAEDGAAAGGVELGDGAEQRGEQDVRHARVAEAAEPLDEADHTGAGLVGAGDGAVQGGVERGRVAAGGQDADALHGGAPSGPASAPFWSPSASNVGALGTASSRSSSCSAGQTCSRNKTAAGS